MTRRRSTGCTTTTWWHASSPWEALILGRTGHCVFAEPQGPASGWTDALHTGLTQAPCLPHACGSGGMVAPLDASSRVVHPPHMQASSCTLRCCTTSTCPPASTCSTTCRTSCTWRWRWPRARRPAPTARRAPSSSSRRAHCGRSAETRSRSSPRSAASACARSPTSSAATGSASRRTSAGRRCVGGHHNPPTQPHTTLTP